MKTNTITTIVLAGILALSLAACSKSEAPTPKISERTEPPKAPQQQPTVPPLGQEAIALAQKAFSEIWTQDADSWFTKEDYNNKIIQIRGVTYQLNPRILSEADTLNGFQWRGDVKFSSRTFREYTLDNQQRSEWTSWHDGSPVSANFSEVTPVTPIGLNYFLEKKNGQWTKSLSGVVVTKPSEEQIKNILTK